jgi:hypothetical protein
MVLPLSLKYIVWDSSLWRGCAAGQCADRGRGLPGRAPLTTRVALRSDNLEVATKAVVGIELLNEFGDGE